MYIVCFRCKNINYYKKSICKKRCEKTIKENFLDGLEYVEYSVWSKLVCRVVCEYVNCVSSVVCDDCASIYDHHLVIQPAKLRVSNVMTPVCYGYYDGIIQVSCTRDDYDPDLTRYGIEPDPGPEYSWWDSKRASPTQQWNIKQPNIHAEIDETNFITLKDSIDYESKYDSDKEDEMGSNTTPLEYKYTVDNVINPIVKDIEFKNTVRKPKKQQKRNHTIKYAKIAVKEGRDKKTDFGKKKNKGSNGNKKHNMTTKDIAKKAIKNSQAVGKAFDSSSHTFNVHYDTDGSDVWVQPTGQEIGIIPSPSIVTTPKTTSVASTLYGVKQPHEDKSPKESEELLEKLTVIKLKDQLDEESGVLRLNNKQPRHIINNNKNRDLVPKLTTYTLDLTLFDRRTLDIAGHPEVGVAKSLDFMMPVGFIEQLETQIMTMPVLDSDSFGVLRLFAYRLLKNLDIPAIVESMCLTWCPIIAWEKSYTNHQLSNPYNGLNYKVAECDFTQLAMIRHQDYTTHNIGCKKFDPTNKLQHKRKFFGKIVDRVRIFWQKCKPSLEHRRLKRYVKNQHMNCNLEMSTSGAVGTSDYRLSNVTLGNYSKEFNIKLNSIELLLHMKKGGWLRDLTREGVESNPGPEFSHDVFQTDLNPKQAKGASLTYPMDLDKQMARKLYKKTGIQNAMFWNHSYRPMCYVNNLDNEEGVIRNRVTVATPKPNDQYMAEFLEFVRNNKQLLFSNRIKPIHAVTWDNYLQRSNASPAVKRLLSDCKNKLDQQSIFDGSDLASNEVHKMVRRSLFLKKENLCYRTPLGVKEKTARAIQGATPEFICIVGPWIMALQDHLKTIWNTKNWMCFTSGIRSDKAASYIANFDGQIVEDDISTFDSSISRPLLLLEWEVCKWFKAPNLVLDLIKANCNTYGYTFFGGKYKMKGCRKSGDPYTSLFNSMLNGFMHAFIVSNWLEISAKRATTIIRMLVAGDDNAMRINSPIRIPFVSEMEKLGFNSEALYRDDIHELEFCSCRVYRVQDTYVFGPMPGKVLTKLGFINNPPPGVTQESMLRGIAMGLLVSCSFIPPIRCVAERILELTQGSRAYVHYSTKFKDEEWSMNFVLPGAIKHHNTNVMYCLNQTYGWTLSHQISLEKYMKTFIVGNNFNHFLTISLLFDRDTAGPAVYH